MSLHLMIVRREGGNEREGKTEKGQKERQREKTNHFLTAALILVHDARFRQN